MHLIHRNFLITGGLILEAAKVLNDDAILTDIQGKDLAATELRLSSVMLRRICKIFDKIEVKAIMLIQMCDKKPLFLILKEGRSVHSTLI